MRQREPLSSLLLYHLSKWSVVSPLLHTYFRGRIYGADNVPTRGGVLVVSNHASYFDPPILSCAVGRPVAFMAKEELFKNPVFKQIIQTYGAYPVKRGKGDRSAIRSAIGALNDGWATGVFLQGNRTQSGKITNPKLGAALIAAKANVPILPVSLWGTEKILLKSRKFPVSTPITVRIGELIAPPQAGEKEELASITQKCAEVINNLHSLGR
ncbi:MAG: 1-acyl-sn-glycerol-3-phosphate acyltransferase [Cyanobacteria bacterium J083]|nr:MAG: 1-acyl-sn-glycerol-3-phosphate acyltransferase [Cyanobacteria bacterium J083]